MCLGYDCSSMLGAHLAHAIANQVPHTCLVYKLVVIVVKLVYKAYTYDCQHEYTFLPRLRPYPLRGYRLSWSLTTLQQKS